MKISVCMALYNGALYVEEQLQSIFNQSRQPDEVIMCDDGSTDDTVEIVQQFIEKNDINDTWLLYQNKVNLGYPGNFYHAMELCTGDIVFLSDQDDIWDNHKIEKMMRVFQDYPSAKLVSCKGLFIGANGKKINNFMNHTKSKNTGKLRNVTVHDVFYKDEWAGLLLAYRNEWYKAWSSGDYKIPHDILIAAKAAEENGLVQLDAYLAYHRIHDNNTGKEEHRIHKLLNKERKLWEINQYLGYLIEYEKKDVFQSEAAKIILKKKKESLIGRLEALESGRIYQIVRNAYLHRNYVRFATSICDLMIVCGQVGKV